MIFDKALSALQQIRDSVRIEVEQFDRDLSTLHSTPVNGKATKDRESTSILLRERGHMQLLLDEFDGTIARVIARSDGVIATPAPSSGNKAVIPGRYTGMKLSAVQAYLCERGCGLVAFANDTKSEIAVAT